MRNEQLYTWIFYQANWKCADSPGLLVLAPQLLLGHFTVLLGEDTVVLSSPKQCPLKIRILPMITWMEVYNLDFISLTWMHHLGRLRELQSQLHFQSHSMNDKPPGLSPPAMTLALDSLPDTATSTKGSLWMCQKQPRASVGRCDTAGQTRDSHIEGEDSTTCLESESQTT